MSTPDTGAPTNPNNPFGDAAAATRAMIDTANAEPVANTAPGAPAPPVDPPTTEPGTEGTTEATPPTPLSWDEIDLSVLPEDQRKVVQEGYLRHSDYTRKTQELAEQRKQFEQFGDVETVQQAMEFVQNLQDPDFLRQLNADIEAHLGAQTPTGQPQAATTDPATSPGLDPVIQAKLDKFDTYLAEQEHAREEAALTEQFQQTLQTAEDAIRRDYPSYSQKDIDTIYTHLGSPDVGWDLFKAQEKHETLRQYYTESLIGNKGNHPDAANPVRSDTLVHQPHEMNSMEEAKKATAALFAQG